MEGEVVGLSEDAVELLGARDEVDLVAGATGPSGGGGVHVDGAQAADDEGIKDLLVVGEDVLFGNDGQPQGLLQRAVCA